MRLTWKTMTSLGQMRPNPSPETIKGHNNNRRRPLLSLSVSRLSQGAMVSIVNNTYVFKIKGVLTVGISVGLSVGLASGLGMLTRNEREYKIQKDLAMLRLKQRKLEQLEKQEAERVKMWDKIYYLKLAHYARKEISEFKLIEALNYFNAKLEVAEAERRLAATAERRLAATAKAERRRLAAKAEAPFSDFGKKAKDLLTKDYNFDQKFTMSVMGSSGLGLTANGLKRGHIFTGDIITLYKNKNTAVDVKVDTYSNVTTKVTMTDLLPSTKIACSFKIPDHKSGKLNVQYLHPVAAIDSSIGLHASPHLELAATVGSKDLRLGGEIGFDTASSLLTKYNAGISFNKPDFSAALLLTDKGQTLKASYIHAVDSSSGTTVAAELTHKFSTSENSFTLGSSHIVDPYTIVKTRFSDSGKTALLWQREWRPKSLITFSGEYDSKANSAPKFGIALALKP